jgi:hypothetical protein
MTEFSALSPITQVGRTGNWGNFIRQGIRQELTSIMDQIKMPIYERLENPLPF